MKQKIYLIVAGLLLFAFQLKAQSPNSLNYQGVARDGNGNALDNQSISLRFTVHKGSATGTSLYQETQPATTNQFGIFSVSIGTGTVQSGNFSNISWGSNVYFLQIEMDPAGGSNYINMGTNQFLSVPYSLYADSASHAVNANSATTSSYSDTATFARNANTAPSVWTTSGTSIYNNNTGAVGIGTTSPEDSAALTILSAHKYGAIIQSDTLSSSAVVVNATYTGTGNYNAVAVMGKSAPADNYGIGGLFAGGYVGSFSTAAGATDGDSYYAANNVATSTGASNVYGTASGASSNGGTSLGTYGNGNDIGAGNGIGIYGAGTSATGVGYGVYGTGSTAGIYGTSAGTGFYATNLGTPYGSELRVVGSFGELTGTTANGSVYEDDGMLGISVMSGNYHSVGVCGYGTNATGSDVGVFGMAQGIGHENYAIAVYGYVDPAQGGGSAGSAVADYAGYFLGNVDVVGTLTASTKNFKIDDPLDPANKYLYHSCVESPDMMNIYNGNITTDAKGNATVTLPDYFQAANTDFKYQLTVIGQFAQAIIGTKVTNNQFTIKTDKPNVEVSWQVTGVRNDPYAKANPTVPEVDKKGIEKGYYLHPECYGLPQSLSIANLIGTGNNTAQIASAPKATGAIVAPQMPTATPVSLKK